MKMDEKTGKNRHLGCSHKKIFELCNSLASQKFVRSVSQKFAMSASQTFGIRGVFCRRTFAENLKQMEIRQEKIFKTIESIY